ncbi:MAG TPA: DNA repair protein RadC [Streptosporangiaceae bacterium]|nr:DNA repair protein RadC [Streptosporangiaceae bacterium]
MATVLSALPKHERPRERLRAVGVEALSERELLALVLRNGRTGESAIDLAGSLLAAFGGLSGLARALPEELAMIPGVGQAKAASLIAALRLGALVGSEVERPVLRSSTDIARVAAEHLRGLRRERVLVLVCDGANRLIQVVTVSEGSLDRSLVPVREILNAVLRHDGRAFALAHNHPSGDTTPSDADRHATTNVMAGAQTVGLRFLDHLVMCCDRWERATPAPRTPH